MCSLPPVRNEHPLPDLSGPSDLSVCTPVTDEDPEVPLQNHAVSSANERISARVARVAYCQDATCSFADLSSHLSVEIDDVPLEPKNATAISYTWGEFHREKISIGHVHGDASAHVQLELGKEWVIRDMIDRLAELSKDSPIWIDQICIPQKKDAIRQVLVSIPAIFRTFDVVALMPGHPCKCLDDLLENRMPLILAEDKVDYEKSQELLHAMELQCPNSLGPSSWFGRIWTWQELVCSRRIRCVWASAQRAMCTPWNAFEKKDLEPYMALWYERLESRGFPEKAILERLQTLRSSWHAGACCDLTAYLKYRDPMVPTIAKVLQFYGGETLQNGHTTSGMTARALVKEFTAQLLCIGTKDRGNHFRRATHSRDYVLSVWVDCPGYIVPRGHDRMNAPELLNDAMAQLMRNHGAALLTNAPRGLFDSEKSGSALFDPITYFSTAPIHHATNLYEHLSKSSSDFSVYQMGAVPVVLSARYPVALSVYAEEYTVFSERFGKAKASILIPFLQDVFRFFCKTCIARTARHRRTWCNLHSKDIYETEYKEELSPEESLRVRRPRALVSKLVWKNEQAQQMLQSRWFNILNDYSTLPDDIFDDILETVLYDLMAASLRISREACRAAGVAMMVDPGDPSVARPPRIGFFRGDVDLRKLRYNQDSGTGTKMAITVCMSTNSEWRDFACGGLGGAPTLPGAPTLLEAYQVEGFGSEEVPKYRVFGVWVPTAVTKSEEYGACLGSLEEGRADAFLI